MTLETLVTGVMGRDWFTSGAITLDRYNPEVNWSALQASAGAALGGSGKTEIDNAISSGRLLRLRVMSGRFAPSWLKTAVGSFTVVNCQDGTQGTVPRWWRSQYVTYYADLMTKLAALYDGVIGGIWEVGNMHIYAEPFQRQFTSTINTPVTNGTTGITKTGVQWAAQNRAAAIAAGYAYGSDTTVGTDLWALDQFRQIMEAAWSQTRVALAYNPLQYINGAGNGVSDQAAAKRQMQLWFAALGVQHIIQNDSIRESFISNPSGPRPYTSTQQIYIDIVAMHVLGCPIAFQTATWDRISNSGSGASAAQKFAALDKTIDWAVDMGAHAVEVPRDFDEGSTDADVAIWSAALAGNAGGAPPSGPGTITAIGFDAGEGVGSPTLRSTGVIIPSGFDAGEGIGRPSLVWVRSGIPVPDPPPPSTRGHIDAAGFGPFSVTHLGRYDPVINLGGSMSGIEDDITALDGWFVGEDKELTFEVPDADSSWTVEFLLTRELDDTVVVSKSSSGIAFPETNMVTVSVPGEDTVDLPETVIYRYALSRTDVDAVLSYGAAVLLLR